MKRHSTPILQHSLKGSSGTKIEQHAEKVRCFAALNKLIAEIEITIEKLSQQPLPSSPPPPFFLHIWFHSLLGLLVRGIPRHQIQNTQRLSFCSAFSCIFWLEVVTKTKACTIGYMSARFFDFYMNEIKRKLRLFSPVKLLFSSRLKMNKYKVHL